MGETFLTGVATDSHRLSSSSLEIKNRSISNSLILPRKTVYQLCSLLNRETNGKLICKLSENKIKFTIRKNEINFKSYRWKIS